MRTITARLVVMVVGTLCPTAEAVAASFHGLGDLSGGGFYSWAHRVSEDGQRVVGASYTDSGIEAFQWDSASGIHGMGNLPGGGNSGANDITWDASSGEWVTVGWAGFRDPALGPNGNTGEAYRATGTSISPDDGLGMLPGAPASRAAAMSDDASTIVGGSGGHAFRWTESTGMVDIGDLPGGSNSAIAYAVSSDGSVVAGAGWSSSGREAYRMTGDTISAGDGLGDLPGGSFYSVAYDISGDGSTVVGYGHSSSGTEAFRWTQETGMVGLGDFSGGGFESYSQGVNGDGSIVVGTSVTSRGREAFIWDADNGMRNLQDVLVNDYGMDLGGWRLTEAIDISNDGRTIVGGGINASGNTEAWIATIPEPPTLALLAMGGCGLLVCGRGRK